MRRSLAYVVSLLTVATACAFLIPVKVPGPLPEGEYVELPSRLTWKLWDLYQFERVPNIYREWFTAVEECMGMSGSFKDIYWYRSSMGRSTSDQLLAGLHIPMEDRSVIVLFGWYDGQERTVKHEIIHHILHRNRGKGDSGHVTDWYEACGKATTNTPAWQRERFGQPMYADSLEIPPAFVRIYAINMTRFDPVFYGLCGGTLGLLGQGQAATPEQPVMIRWFDVPGDQICGWGQVVIRVGNLSYEWDRTRTADVKPGALVFCIWGDRARLRAYRQPEPVPFDCS